MCGQTVQILRGTCPNTELAQHIGLFANRNDFCWAGSIDCGPQYGAPREDCHLLWGEEHYLAELSVDELPDLCGECMYPDDDDEDDPLADWHRGDSTHTEMNVMYGVVEDFYHSFQANSNAAEVDAAWEATATEREYRLQAQEQGIYAYLDYNPPVAPEYENSWVNTQQHAELNKHYLTHPLPNITQPTAVTNEFRRRRRRRSRRLRQLLGPPDGADDDDELHSDTSYITAYNTGNVERLLHDPTESQDPFAEQGPHFESISNWAQNKPQHQPLHEVEARIYREFDRRQQLARHPPPPDDATLEEQRIRSHLTRIKAREFFNRGDQADDFRAWHGGNVTSLDRFVHGDPSAVQQREMPGGGDYVGDVEGGYEDPRGGDWSDDEEGSDGSQ